MITQLEEQYYEWILCTINDTHKNRRYSKLLKTLFNIPFYYTIPLDHNRESDGISLRYEYCEYANLDYRVVAAQIDYKPCSMLEMMTALALRGHRYFMPEFKNYISIWFWDMINNLGLRCYDDQNYNHAEVCKIINNFMNRRYEPNGFGGLFKINGFKKDLRSMEIWAQFTNYISTYYVKE